MTLNIKKLFRLGLVIALSHLWLHGQDSAAAGSRSVNAETAGAAMAMVSEDPVEDAIKAAPTQMSLLDDDWELKIGDRLIYQVLEEREEPLLLSVNGNGELLLPLVGTLPAQGKTSRELAYEIKEKLEADFFHRATVMITQRETDRNRGRIMVVGEVNKQGEQLIPADSPLTLSQAVMQGGGFTVNADRTKVSVVGEGEEDPRIELDLGKMLSSGDLSRDPMLKAGDVVIVPRANQAGSQVYVLGAVQSPGLYTITGSEYRLSQVILMANGFTRFARSNKVRLITTGPDGEKAEETVNVEKVLSGGDRSQDPVVKPGDMVIVDEKMISFSG